MRSEAVATSTYLLFGSIPKPLYTALSLAQQLSTELRLPVDVRVLNGAPPSFLHHVLRGKLLISRDDELLSSLIENTARLYLDIAPLRRRATKEAFAV